MDFERSYRLGGGEHFVVEGDEYDSAFFDKRPKFLHYLPDIAIIGNVEYDHADIYPDLAAVQRAFVHLMNVVPRRGLLVAGLETPALRELLPRAHCRVETFGLGEGGGLARRTDVRAADGRAGASACCHAGAGPGRVPAPARRASTTCATRWPPWPRPTRSGCRPEQARDGPGRVPRA